MKRTLFDDEHHLYRESVRRFVQTEVVPHRQQWEEQGKVDRSLFTAAGKAGILGIAAPTEFGGGGVQDFRFNAILSEELAAADVLGSGLGLAMQADIALPYLLSLTSPSRRAVVRMLATSDPAPGRKLVKVGQRAADTSELS